MKGHEAYLAMIGAVDEQLAIRERAVAELAAVGERAGKAAKEHDEATEAIRVVVADFLRGERASLDPIGLRHTASIGGVLTRRPDPRAALSAVLDMNGIPPHRCAPAAPRSTSATWALPRRKNWKLISPGAYALT